MNGSSTTPCETRHVQDRKRVFKVDSAEAAAAAALKVMGRWGHWKPNWARIEAWTLQRLPVVNPANFLFSRQAEISRELLHRASPRPHPAFCSCELAVHAPTQLFSR